MSLDVIILSIFTFFVTYQPFILYEEVLYWEMGIYLPSIQAVLDGMAPYRDFFYLRGPFEIYVPTALMAFFGENMAVLYYFFYVGTVLGLVMVVLIGQEIYKTRLFLYLMVPVVVARTFPRVYYWNWGGMRYALGLIVLWCTVRFFKTHKKCYLYASAFFSFATFFTSSDVGLISMIAVGLSLVIYQWIKIKDFQNIKWAFGHYALAVMILFMSYGTYLFATDSLAPYLETTYTIATSITRVFDTSVNSKYPASLGEWLWAFVPSSDYFKHITPAYFYIFFAAFLYFSRSKQLGDRLCGGFITIAIYGLLLYMAAWRRVENAQFEMALQPEKILFFLLLERAYFYLKDKKDHILRIYNHSWRFRANQWFQYLKLYGIVFLFIVLLGSSWGYAFNRYAKRFVAVKFACFRLLGKDTAALEPMAHLQKRKLTIPRAYGMIIPVDEAKDYEELVAKIQERAKPNEVVFTYPEHGLYNFLFDRPFLGRFAMAKYSWFKDQWHDELMSDLKNKKPRYIVIPKAMFEGWDEYNFSYTPNKAKYDELMRYVSNHYHVAASTLKSDIYELSR